VEAGKADEARWQMRVHLMNTAKDIEAVLGEEPRELDGVSTTDT
jgi:hypothetical protein